MITRFPAPWRIVELPHGFAVEDAPGKQIGVFYGRAPDTAGHTGIMAMDEARQMAVDFARLPELLKQSIVRSPLRGAHIDWRGHRGPCGYAYRGRPLSSLRAPGPCSYAHDHGLTAAAPAAEMDAWLQSRGVMLVRIS